MSLQIGYVLEHQSRVTEVSSAAVLRREKNGHCLAASSGCMLAAKYPSEWQIAKGAYQQMPTQETDKPQTYTSSFVNSVAWSRYVT